MSKFLTIILIFIGIAICQAEKSNIVPIEYSEKSIDRIFHQKNWSPTMRADYNDSHYSRKSWTELKELLILSR